MAKAKKTESEVPAWYEEIGGDLARSMTQPSDSIFEYVLKSTAQVVVGGAALYGVKKIGTPAVTFVKGLFSKKEDNSENVLDLVSGE